MSKMKKVVPITGPDMDTSLADIETAESMDSVHGVEIRYDMIKSPDLEKLMSAPEKPVVFTNMGLDEGGRFDGRDPEWLDIYHEAVELKPAAISVGSGYYRHIGNHPGNGIDLIWTYHNFKETPEELVQFYCWSLANAMPKPDIMKLATMAKNPGDALRMLDLINFAHGMGNRIIGLPMGKFGVWVRVVGCTYGNELTFAALSEDKTSGPGQPTVDDLVEAAKRMQLPE